MAEYTCDFTVTFDFEIKETGKALTPISRTGSRNIEADSPEVAEEIMQDEWEDACVDDWVMDMPDEYWDKTYNCLCTNLDIDKVTLVG